MEVEPLKVNEEAAWKDMASFPTGTGCGKDGLKAQHFKDAITHVSADFKIKLEKVWTDFLNSLLSAKNPFRSVFVYCFSPSSIPKEKGWWNSPYSSG